MVFLELGIAILSGVVALTIYAHWHRGIFRKMGVPCAPTVPFLGSFTAFSKLPSIFDMDTYHLKNYGANDGKVVGVFDGRTPVLLIGDAEMIRTASQKQSSDFYDRPTYLDDDPSLFRLTLLNLRGAHWKRIRQLLTPTFTPGSLRRMTPLAEQCAVHMVKHDLKPIKGDALDIRDVAGRFTLRTIASIAFGIDLKGSSKEVEDHFVKTSIDLFAFFESPWAIFLFAVPHVARVTIKALHYLGYQTLLERSVNTLAQIAKTEIDRRKKEKTTRDDFLQAMMALEEQHSANPLENTGLSSDEMIAQCVLFLSGAYETTASTLTFFCISMAQNPDCQQRLREDIKKAGLDGDSEITYEKLASLNYLEMCIFESMRVYPPVFRTNRVCTAKEGTTLSGIPIPNGLFIGIPIATMHQMAEFWPEPERFDPERFVNGIPPEAAFAYMPFGIGPHQCIGERLGKLELRVAIVAMLRKYRIELSEHTHLPVKIAATGMRTPVEPVYLRFVESPI